MKEQSKMILFLIGCCIVVRVLTGGPQPAEKATSSGQIAASVAQAAAPWPAVTAQSLTTATSKPDSTATVTPKATATPTPFKNRVVKLDLEGEKPDKTDQIAMAIIKKMKWSLSGDAATAAREDAEQFLSVAAGMKSYPDFVVKNLVMGSGRESFDNSLEIP
jgi:hypothetical protein